MTREERYAWKALEVLGSIDSTLEEIRDALSNCVRRPRETELVLIQRALRTLPKPDHVSYIGDHKYVNGLQA